MTYEMSGNPDTIYVDVNTATPGFALIIVFVVFLGVGVVCLLTFVSRWLGLRRYPGFSMDGGTVLRGVGALVCLAGCLASLGAYALSPSYRAEQAAQGERAVAAVRERYGLDAHCEFVPYNPFDDEDTSFGRLYIDADGRSWPTRVTRATYQSRYDHRDVTRSSDETFVVEVLTDSGYVPISDFARAHGGEVAY